MRGEGVRCEGCNVAGCVHVLLYVHIRLQEPYLLMESSAQGHQLWPTAQSDSCKDTAAGPAGCQESGCDH